MLIAGHMGAEVDVTSVSVSYITSTFSYLQCMLMHYIMNCFYFIMNINATLKVAIYVCREKMLK